MKKVKKVFKISTLFSIFFLVLTSCHKIAGNDIDYFYCKTNQIDNDIFEIFNCYGEGYKINLRSCKFENFSNYKNENYRFQNCVIEGGTAPRYDLVYDDGYDKLAENILSLDLNTSRSVLYTKGYLFEKDVFGILHLYNDTIGYLSGGGNYGIEEINCSIFYKYNKASNDFRIIKKFEKSYIVAFNDRAISYWKNKKYYVLNLINNEEKMLFKDKAYDRGIQHQSRQTVYFGKRYFVYDLVKAKFFYENNYFKIYDSFADRLVDFGSLIK